MVAIGLIYLLFESRLLRNSASIGGSKQPAASLLSRSLIGVQV